MVRLDAIEPNPYQPKTRISVPPETAKKFADSILEHGLIQTPVVRKVGDHYEMADGWLRRAGFKYLAQSGHAEYKDIPVQVRQLSDLQMADSIMEANTKRQDLNPIELANLFKKYVDKFGVSQDELARRHNCTQGEISNTMRLLDLPDVIQYKIVACGLKETHARYLLQLKDTLQMTLLSDEIISKGMTVVAVDARIRELLQKEPKKKPEAPAPQPVQQAPAPKVEEKAEPPKAAPPVSKTPEPAKHTPTKTATPAAPVSTAVKPTWKRKLVLEEKDGYVMASVMKEGTFPVMRKLEGTLEHVIEQPSISETNDLDVPVLKFLGEVTEQWQKESK